MVDPIPSPPVHAARLNALLKTLASAEGAVNESIKARRSLIEGLEKLLDVSRSMLATDESKHSDLLRRKTNTEAKKRDVEDGIMRGLTGSDSFTTSGSNGNSDGHVVSGDEPERPDVEPLSPPSVEALTPTCSPPPISLTGTAIASDIKHESHSDSIESTSAVPVPLVHAGSDLLSSLSMPYGRQTSGSPVNGGTKKLKLNDELEFDGDAMDGLDDEVAAMLRQQSSGS